LKALTRKNFNKVIILAKYNNTAENEAALCEPKEDTLIVSLNGHRNHLSDCILHADYDIDKMIAHYADDHPFPWKKQPILSFRDYMDKYPDYVIDCREFDFTGYSVTTAIKFFIYNNIHNILLYMNNGQYDDNFKNRVKAQINEVKECHPNCNIYKIGKDGNFDLETKSVKEFYGIHC